MNARRYWFGRTVRAGLAAVTGLVFLLTTGCDSLISLHTLRVDSHPHLRNQVLDAAEPIVLRFDRPMNEHSVEQIFHVNDPTGVVSGRYTWNGNRVSFHPARPLAPGVRYLLNIKGSAVDRAGRRHQVSRTVPFYILSADHDPPAVASVVPEPGAIIGPASPIAIAFTTTMQRATVEEELLVQPSSAVHRTWDDNDTTLTLRPLDRWPYPGTLTIRIAAAATDTSGASLVREARFTFVVQAGTIRPEVVTVESIVSDRYSPEPFAGPGDDLAVPGYVLSSGSAVRTRFSNEMDRSSAERAFSLSPPVQGTIYWPGPTIMVFDPATGFLPDQEYRLTISDRAADIDGNRLTEPLLLQLHTTHGYLELTQLTVWSGSQTVLTSYQENTAVEISSGDPPYFPSTLTLSFSQPFASDEGKQRLLDALSLSTLLPGVFTSPTRVGYSWIDGQTVAVSYHGLRPSTRESRNYLLFELRGGPAGPRSGIGSYLETGVRQLLVVEES